MTHLSHSVSQTDLFLRQEKYISAESEVLPTPLTYSPQQANEKQFTVRSQSAQAGWSVLSIRKLYFFKSQLSLVYNGEGLTNDYSKDQMITMENTIGHMKTLLFSVVNKENHTGSHKMPHPCQDSPVQEFCFAFCTHMHTEFINTVRKVIRNSVTIYSNKVLWNPNFLKFLNFFFFQ